MVLEVAGQILAAVEALLELGVGDVARHDHRAREREPRGHRVLAQLGQDLAHRPAQVDLHHLAAQVVVGDLGQEVRGVGLELLEEDAVAR